MAENDLGKIVNLIMQNPTLIEEIKKLNEKSADDEAEDESNTEAGQVTESGESEEIKANAEIDKGNSRSRRRELLCALKPYVSEERSRAIDSMMSIADILDVMRSK